MRRVILLAGLFALPSFGVTIYSVMAESEGSPWSVSPTQYVYGSWTQTGSYTNVSVSAVLSGSETGSFMAYLTTQIGPGTDSGDQIATMTDSFPGASTLVGLFSGLDLGPGTYYLVFSSDDNGGTWPEGLSPMVTTDSGVTANGYGYCNSMGCLDAYPPATTFTSFGLNSQFLVTGDPAGVPEPATSALLGSGLLALVFLARRNRRSGL